VSSSMEDLYLWWATSCCRMRPEALCCTSFNGEFTGTVEINNGGTFNATSIKMNLWMVFFQSPDLLMVWILLLPAGCELVTLLAGSSSRSPAGTSAMAPPFIPVDGAGAAGRRQVAHSGMEPG